jgi:antitoxin (DNA-binding transcriptional repressor) of toxin-antitoxin stability system
MTRVGVAEAALRLAELLERAVAGEDIEIHWGGTAPVRLAPRSGAEEDAERAEAA